MIWWAMLPGWAKAAIGGALVAAVVGAGAWAYLAQRDNQAAQQERERIRAQSYIDYQDARRRADAAETGADLSDDERIDWLRRYSTGR